ncbi:LacI family DNA-binding transcriptional regulator [Agrobacterium rosae]|uniref:HTH-type transcriptional repressor CytR n=1 Tax=Agrobacterium rosae TaxID=1972867 RepID=A0A1R3TR72_9HYPH|nr:LacI family DNA-binding transcriptional regulator [Agrobacterium rosae]SCX23600.1 HTH-type transcriptional repressor CytR [Agrobacterium rosae]
MSIPSSATIEDVARIAEVSIATVSRAIHNPEKVANSTRLKVNQAIAVTGYTTNAMARSLRLGRSNMILVVAPDIGDPNFSNILVGLENEARSHGYGILIGHTQNDAQRGLEYLKFLNSNQAAGLILFTGILPFGHQAMTARLPPSVGVFEPIYNGGIPYVGVDDTAGSRKIVDMLIAEGHKRIAFIGDSRVRLAYNRRRKGYDEGMLAAGLTPAPAMIIEGDGTLESGRLAIEQLFMRDTLPTAFMCVNDQTAIGVMIGLTARGYDIPKDFSVTGFDDIPQAVFMSPALTTIRQPRTSIGKHAMALLLDLLGGQQPDHPEILLTPDLIVRNSVGAPTRRLTHK